MDILFVLWAVRVLTEGGVRSLKIDGRHAADEPWLRERLAGDGDSVEIHDFLKLLKKTGHVHFDGCRLAAATFEVKETNLIPETDGIVDSAWFLDEKAWTSSLPSGGFGASLLYAGVGVDHCILARQLHDACERSGQ